MKPTECPTYKKKKRCCVVCREIKYSEEHGDECDEENKI